MPGARVGVVAVGVVAVCVRGGGYRVQGTGYMAQGTGCGVTHSFLRSRATRADSALRCMRCVSFACE